MERIEAVRRDLLMAINNATSELDSDSHSERAARRILEVAARKALSDLDGVLVGVPS